MERRGIEHMTGEVVAFPTPPDRDERVHAIETNSAKHRLALQTEERIKQLVLRNRVRLREEEFKRRQLNLPLEAEPAEVERCPPLQSFWK